MFNLLLNLSSKTRNRIKQVAQYLIEAVKAQLKQLEIGKLAE